MNFETFHFLRPAWLLAGLALLPMLWLAGRARREAGAWQRVCDAPLLSALLVEAGGRGSRWGLGLFSLGWLASALAMAGPSWERLPQPAFEAPTQSVLVLDLAGSMRATDVAPSRAARARFEVTDLLEQVEGAVALVLYAEFPYAVTPLADDPDVVAALLPVLEPGLMPGRGERLDRAIDEARLLLERAGAQDGRIVVVADGLGDHPDDALAAAGRAAKAGFRVATLGIAGDLEGLAELAREGGGNFAALTADDSDVEAVLAGPGASIGDLGDLSPSQVEADVWEDMGAWLLWLPLCLAPLAFRRGWATALALPLMLGVVAPAPAARAADLESWLLRGDQRGARAFEAGEHARAADLFEDAAWRGASQYRGGDYAAAAASLGELAGAESRYNLGNALAHAGDLGGAIAAYDEALAAEPGHEDARHNRDWVEKLLEEQDPPPQPQQSEEEESADSDPSEGQDTAESQESEGSEASGSGAPDSAPDASDGSEAGEGAERSESAQGADAGESESASSGAEPAEAEEPEGAAESAGDLDADAQRSASRGSEAGESSQSGDESREAGRDPAADSPREGQRPEPGPAQVGQAGEKPAPETAGAQPGAAREVSESDQEVQQWLNRVPDDPGGLLREKLRRRYAEQRFGGARGER